MRRGRGTLAPVNDSLWSTIADLLLVISIVILPLTANFGSIEASNSSRPSAAFTNC